MVTGHDEQGRAKGGFENGIRMAIHFYVIPNFLNDSILSNQVGHSNNPHIGFSVIFFLSPHIVRRYNLSLLITDEFVEAVKNDREWKLAFPLSIKEHDAAMNLADTSAYVWREWPQNEGYVTRDAREVERKKVGLRKARRRPQYSKR